MDLIEKDKLIEILAEMQGRCATKAALVQNSKIWQQVKDMPTVDAIPVEWIRKYTEENRLYQSDDFDLYISDMIADWAERKEE